MRSVFPDETGQPIYKAGTTIVDQTTPLEDRQGGWFVTGTSSNHRGNMIFQETERGADEGQLFDMRNIRDNEYPGEGSDFVAQSSHRLD
jgi:hypothetical protein